MRIYSLFFLIFSTITNAANLSNIVVFGDSLSDTGNLYKATEGQLPASPPYFAGRFSNGPVWVEQLLTTLFPDTKDLPLDNYAFGGALATQDDTSMHLDTEISLYFNANQKTDYSKNLYVIWIGSNDYLKSQDSAANTVKQVNKSIKNGMNRLIEKGARYFLIMNLPDIGQSPKASAGNAVAHLSDITNKHNRKLAKVVHKMNDREGILALYVDVNAEFAEIIAHPEQAGFANVRDNCLEKNKDDLALCDNWFFFDSLHPTTKTHGLIAEKLAHILGEARIYLGGS